MSKIPKFKTLDDARDFWDTHDSADYQSGMHDVDVEAPGHQDLAKRITTTYVELLAVLESIVKEAEEGALVGPKKARTIGAATYRKARAALRRALDVTRETGLKQATGGRGR